MPAMTIKLDSQGLWPDLVDKSVTTLDPMAPPIQVAVFEHGMADGAPSVALRLDLPDGSVVIAETSARLFVNASTLIKAKYPELDP